jgi:hypothetical protein
LAASPAVVARFQSSSGSFDIIHIDLRASQAAFESSLSVERWIVGELLSRHPFSLFIFSNVDRQHWHLVSVPFATQTSRRQLHRRLLLGSDQPLALAARCLSRIDLTELDSGHPSLSPQLIQQCHDRAFDPGAAAGRFYKEFEDIYQELHEELCSQTAQARWSRAHAFELLSRLLFISIVQRTRLLAGDSSFLTNLWKAYRQTKCDGYTFVQDWLEGALFRVLSSSGQARTRPVQHLPSVIRRLMMDLPCFEGGLFACNIATSGQEPTHWPAVTDHTFQRILEFLNSYPFTAREDTALDQQLAVGPAMLGQVYEGLVNAAEERSQRSESGIYYTAPTEVGLMCRLALADWLANHLGHEHQSWLLHALFASGPGAERAADAALARRGVWPRIKELLERVSVVDPACGSGSFLVGMFQVLDGFLTRANRQAGDLDTKPERRRRILATGLHGVDLKEWAVAIARSRLSLQIAGWSTVNEVQSTTDLRLPFLGTKMVSGESLLISTAEGEPAWQNILHEIHSGERSGFDLVIGNPPYVRQERIDDPRRDTGGEEERDGVLYKARLARSVYTAWPRTFGYSVAQDRAQQTLDARSDLYIYFYFLGLALLHDKGTLCFVTSNSWLDARYGRDLQRHLLTRGHVKLLIDNQANRSFGGAEVNTVIALLGAAHDRETSRTESLRNTVRFVVLRIAFQEALHPEIWEEVTEATGRHRTADFQVLSRTQAQLLGSGRASKASQYRGDKWGSKYLREPDIYRRLQQQYQRGLVRLGDIAVVRRGVTTGANDFFFLDEECLARWDIEPEYLVPALKSPRSCHRVWLEPGRDMSSYLFMCHRERDDLQGTRALAYIEHGEARGLHQRPTCRRRLRWWDLGLHPGARVHCNYLVDKAMRFYAGEEPFLAGDGFQAIHSDLAPEVLAAACNSTLCQLSVNVLGRSNFGGGLLKLQTYEVRELLIPDPRLLGTDVRRTIEGAGLLGLDDPDRHALDELVASAVGLTPADRQAVQTAVETMVATRVSKARN